MGKINLLIANANTKFSINEIDIIKQSTIASEKFIVDNFNFDYDVDLVVTAPSLLMSTIPEDGITGRTFSSNLIMVVIDNQQAEISEDIIFETICHEMAHSLRWEKVPEYSNTMFEGFILEGLAIALEIEAMNSTKRSKRQFFLREIQNTDEATINKLISHLNTNFDDEQYDYDKIFYTGDDSIPRWAGYRLGYYFVKEYLEKTNSTIFQATLASYNDFK